LRKLIHKISLRRDIAEKNAKVGVKYQSINQSVNQYFHVRLKYSHVKVLWPTNEC